jgi:O-glycosyl hydrolase
MPTAAQIARFLACFDALSRFEAQQQVIRGYGAFDRKEWPDTPDPAVVEVVGWLKSHAHV